MVTAEIVIKTDKLTKRFGDFVATDAVTFEVFKGEIFGFLGANGAGKTTAMRMLCGLSIDIVTRNRRLTARWNTQTAQHPHRCCFAGTVCTQKPENFTFENLKSNRIGCHEITEAFRQFIRFYDNFRRDQF